MVVVPNSLRDAINKKLDAEIDRHPGAEPDRDALFSHLLTFFNEHGYVPEFTLEKKS